MATSINIIVLLDVVHTLLGMEPFTTDFVEVVRRVRIQIMTIHKQESHVKIVCFRIIPTTTMHWIVNNVTCILGETLKGLDVTNVTQATMQKHGNYLQLSPGIVHATRGMKGGLLPAHIQLFRVVYVIMANIH